MSGTDDRRQRHERACCSDSPLVVESWWTALLELNAYESSCLGRPRSEEADRRAIRIEHVKCRAVRATVDDVTNPKPEARRSCPNRLQLDAILNTQ